MKQRTLIMIVLITVTLVIAILAATLALTPDQTDPAFDAAIRFNQALGSGDDENALALMGDELRAYVEANCPDGSPSACVDAYTPEEWGDMLSVVYRRSAPDNGAHDVDLIATYEEGTGFSGVCIYNRVEPIGEGWQITAWAGYVHCGDAASRNMESNPDAPNRAP